MIVTALATAVAWSMATVLLVAALEKARHPGPTAMTIQSLGFPARAALPLALALTAAELAAALAIVLAPGSGLAQAGVMALAFAFAAAGLAAMRLDNRVPCSCFGSGGGNLGKRQLIALLPWTAGVAILRFADWRPPDVAFGAVSFAAIAIAIACVRAAGAFGARGEAAADRRTAEETYEWLPSY